MGTAVVNSSNSEVEVLFHPELLKKFDINGPRYTSYPSADRFDNEFAEADYLGALKPYVGAGVNYTIFSNRNNLGNGAYSVDSSSVGAVGQVGADYMLDKNWGLNIDVKYATMSTNVTSAAGVNGGKLTLNPWMPSVGVAYKF
jgi:outer membrane autotransporter protein